MENIIQMYENYKTALPKILLETSVVNESTNVNFFPTIDDCMFCLKKITDEVVNVVQQIPDIKVLYESQTANPDGPPKDAYFRIPIPSHFNQFITSRFHAVMEEWAVEPRAFVTALYEKFAPILNGEAKARANEFILGKRDFAEGVNELPYFQQFMDMTYEIPKNVYFDRIRLNNEDVITGMMDVAKVHFNMLLDYLTKFYRKHNLK